MPEGIPFKSLEEVLDFLQKAKKIKDMGGMGGVELPPVKPPNRRHEPPPEHEDDSNYGDVILTKIQELNDKLDKVVNGSNSLAKLFMQYADRIDKFMQLQTIETKRIGQLFDTPKPKVLPKIKKKK